MTLALLIQFRNCWKPNTTNFNDDTLQALNLWWNLAIQLPLSISIENTEGSLNLNIFLQSSYPSPYYYTVNLYQHVIITKKF